MLRALWTAASGMVAQQHNIDIISNNLSNVNTTAFKKSRAEFQDLLYQVIRPAGITNNFGTQYPTPIEIGHGVRLAATTKSFLQGSPVETNNPFDLAIQGDGFFMVQLPNGQIAYTRDGSFKIDAQGNLVTSNGYLVQPDIVIPPEAQRIAIRENGDVMVSLVNETDAQLVGQLHIVKFANPAGLESIGNNLYVETESSGQPIEGIPGYEGMGTILQGYLESSNVKVIEEMINLITSQRAYEINARAIQTSDDMLGIANDLKR
ncbi:MAG: flagellar basal-body rod protein FlgG [Candidatus Goldbacteria bacterium]|nr:flagellar basal-body rod protein FlgG [Candidatus Goldiibacteriota bacterium]